MEQVKEEHLESLRARINKPSGIWQIIQAILTTGLLLVGTFLINVARDANALQQANSVSLVKLQEQMVAQSTQLSFLRDVPAQLAKIETKLDNDEQRLRDLERIRTLK